MREPSEDAAAKAEQPPFSVAHQQWLDGSEKTRGGKIASARPQPGAHHSAAAEQWQQTAAACQAARGSSLLVPLLTLHNLTAAIDCAISAGHVNSSHAMPGGMTLTAVVQQVALASEATHHLLLLYGPPGTDSATSAERELLRVVTLAVEGLRQRLPVLWHRMGFTGDPGNEVEQSSSVDETQRLAFQGGHYSGAEAMFYGGYLEARDAGLA